VVTLQPLRYFLAADGIRVNAICHGGVSTPINADEPEGGVVPLTPLGRRVHVSEISGAIVYLPSTDASFVTSSEPRAPNYAGSGPSRNRSSSSTPCSV
jgi:NAD(P)-dependent dehydrogenase (short-subunit alcohol dehydrogenase family)